MGYIRFQISAGLAGQNIQDNSVGDELGISWVFLQRSVECGFGFGQATKVEFCDGLADDGQRGRCAGSGGEFFVDVEG